MTIDKSKIIFDLTNPNFSYKGVLFAEVDDDLVNEQSKCTFPKTSTNCAGIMAIIWTDENESWHWKLRIKFPSGNKQVYESIFNLSAEEKELITETHLLDYLYKFPMKNKRWLKNLDGTAEGILKLIEDADMIESRITIKTDEEK